MKKILLICLLIATGLSMVACTTTSTPTAAWAGVEVLNYKITTGDESEIGTMSTTIRRKTADSFTNVMEGETYSTADCSMDMVVSTDAYSITTAILAKGYNTLAIKKVYVDKNDSAKSYTMTGYHSGKYFYYFIDGVEQDKLKVGSSGYTDSEFIYSYIRCYGITSVPSSIKVADFKNKTVTEVTTSYVESAELFNAVPYPDSTKTIICNKVTISLSDTPVGEGITVYYTPDSDDYNVESFKESATISKKMPVQIIENDITYTLISMYIA